MLQRLKSSFTPGLLSLSKKKQEKLSNDKITTLLYVDIFRSNYPIEWICSPNSNIFETTIEIFELQEFSLHNLDFFRVFAKEDINKFILYFLRHSHKFEKHRLPKSSEHFHNLIYNMILLTTSESEIKPENDILIALNYEDKNKDKDRDEIENNILDYKTILRICSRSFIYICDTRIIRKNISLQLIESIPLNMAIKWMKTDNFVNIENYIDYLNISGCMKDSELNSKFGYLFNDDYFLKPKSNRIEIYNMNENDISYPNIVSLENLCKQFEFVSKFEYRFIVRKIIVDLGISGIFDLISDDCVYNYELFNIDNLIKTEKQGIIADFINMIHDTNLIEMSVQTYSLLSDNILSIFPSVIGYLIKKGYHYKTMGVLTK